MQRELVTGPLCPVCHGTGYTPATCAEMTMVWSNEMGAYVEQKTMRQGSGCPRCLGVGCVRV